MDTKVFYCDYANPAHRQAIGMLTNAYINDEMGGGSPLTEAEQTNLVEGLENHPKSIVLLAETDGIFCGLLTAFENFATFTVSPMINIHDVIVLKTHRGKGIGRKLMQTLTAEAEKRACSRITLEVRKDNYSAQHLYRSEGFGDAEPVHYYWRKYISSMRLLLILLISIVSTMAQAQRVYYSADSFPLLGKVSEHTETRYERLPERLKNISREKLWSLGKNTAGLAIRFRSNTTSIAAGWEPLNDAYMNHMTPTGIKGLDLYSLENGEWIFVNSGRPNGKISDALIISNMTPEMREYMLYLPLYDGITSLQIGIDSLAFIGQPLVDSPKREKPVVCYGSSILQGGCATRPGMAHTNILSRRFNREFINLGFSGNALLDYEIAEIIAPVDASLYILDFVPNASVNEMKEKAEYFYAIIRKIRPDTPILFVEDPVFTHTRFDQRIAKEVSDKNATIGQIVEMLKAKGDKNIYLVSSKDMLGHDGEATVDGIHFTDLGFMRFADLLYPYIKERIE